jgi:hypothetical protein
VLRICEGKDHGLLLDVTDNTSRLCPTTNLDDIRVTVPKSVEAAEAKEKLIWKLCPNCEVECHIALRECPECGFEWPENECSVAKFLPEMEYVAFIPSPPEWYDIEDWSIEPHTSKKNNKELGRVKFVYAETEYKTTEVSMWLCFPDYYDGYAVKIAREKWSEISDAKFPISVEEFMDSVFKTPKQVCVDINDRWPQLVSVYCDAGEVGFELYDDDDVPF